MTQDLSPHPPEIPIEKPRPMRPGRVAIAGVFGACALGVGLGLWARPAPPQTPVVAERPEPPRPLLQIVVDDTLPPADALLEVLPADLSPTPRSGLPRLIPVEPQAPRRPAAGLVKVDAVVAAPSPVTAVRVIPAKTRVEPATVSVPAERPAGVAMPEPRPSAAKARKVTAAKAARPERQARAERPDKPRVAKAGVAKAPKAKAVKLARAEPKKTPAAKTADARPDRRAILVKSKAAPKKAVVKARATVVKKKATRVAEAKPPVVKTKVAKAKVGEAKVAGAKVAKAKVVRAKIVKDGAARPAPIRKPKAVTAKAPAPKAQAAKARRPAPAPRQIVPRGEGPMRVAKSEPCALADPGEALVCADRRLAARDRQLLRAYRDAEAAGVPASALRRQQARWVQARAAAARDAPWAVEDVYVARISELNDLSRDARDN